jgi:hypothetical protein
VAIYCLMMCTGKGFRPLFIVVALRGVVGAREELLHAGWYD